MADPGQMSTGIQAVSTEVNFLQVGGMPIIGHGVDFTVALSDLGGFLMIGNCVGTIPGDANLVAPIGASFIACANAATPFTFQAGAGATLHSAGTTVTAEYNVITFRKVAANTWIAYGAGLA